MITFLPRRQHAASQVENQHANTSSCLLETQTLSAVSSFKEVPLASGRSDRFFNTSNVHGMLQKLDPSQISHLNLDAVANHPLQQLGVEEGRNLSKLPHGRAVLESAAGDAMEEP